MVGKAKSTLCARVLESGSSPLGRGCGKKIAFCPLHLRRVCDFTIAALRLEDDGISAIVFERLFRFALYVGDATSRQNLDTFRTCDEKPDEVPLLLAHTRPTQPGIIEIREALCNYATCRSSGKEKSVDSAHILKWVLDILQGGFSRTNIIPGYTLLKPWPSL